MAKDVIMPVLGMNQDTALLVEWLANEGDTVTEGEPIMEVETDKAVMQLDAPASGVLVDVTAAAGDDVTVGSVIARIVAEGEAPPPPAPDASAGSGDSKSASSAPSASDAPASDAPASEPAPPAPSPAASTSAASTSVPAQERSGPRTPASPLARRTAEERGLDLDALPGSGPHGAVLMRDVPEADEAATAAGTAAEAAPAAGPALTPTVAAAPQAELERRLDAEHLLGLLGDGGAPLSAAVARFLAAVVARRLPVDLTGGVTLDVRGPDGRAAIAHAERRSILDLADLLSSGGADAGDAGAPTAVLVHAGDAPMDAVRPNADAPVALGLARPDAGTTVVLTLRYRTDHVDDALAMTMLADLARLVADPSVLAVAF